MKTPDVATIKPHLWMKNNKQKKHWNCHSVHPCWTCVRRFWNAQNFLFGFVRFTGVTAMLSNKCRNPQIHGKLSSRHTAHLNKPACNIKSSTNQHSSHVSLTRTGLNRTKLSWSPRKNSWLPTKQQHHWTSDEAPPEPKFEIINPSHTLFHQTCSLFFSNPHYVTITGNFSCNLA